MNPIIVIRERYRIEKWPDGYYAVEVRDGVRPLSAKCIGPCVTVKQAEYLANHGVTMIGR